VHASRSHCLVRTHAGSQFACNPMAIMTPCGFCMAGGKVPTGQEEYDAATGRYKAVKHWMQSKVRSLAQGMAARLGFPTRIYRQGCAA